PGHVTFGSTGEMAIERSVSYVSAPERSRLTGPPEAFCFVLSLRVRSGLAAVHRRPPSVDLKTTFPPTYTSFASVAETAIGDVQLNRYLRSAGGASPAP